MKYIDIKEIYENVMAAPYRNYDGNNVTLKENLEENNLTEDEKKDKINFTVHCQYFFVLASEGKTESEIEEWINQISNEVYAKYQKEYKA
jgi:hypothetical protein